MTIEKVTWVCTLCNYRGETPEHNGPSGLPCNGGMDAVEHEPDRQIVLDARLAAVRAICEVELAKLQGVGGLDAGLARLVSTALLEVRTGIELWRFEQDVKEPLLMATVLMGVVSDLMSTALLQLTHKTQDERRRWLWKQMDPILQKLIRQRLLPAQPEEKSNVLAANGQPFKRKMH